MTMSNFRKKPVVIEARQLVDDLPTLLEQLEDQSVSSRFLLFLDGVTDPHNLGAIMRTADAAGVSAVVAPKDHSAPLNDVVMRVAAGGADGAVGTATTANHHELARSRRCYVCALVAGPMAPWCGFTAFGSGAGGPV